MLSPRPFPPPACDAVFIHGGWRSTGTWIWSEFRSRPDVAGFYEPLHELLKDIKLEGIRSESASDWDSRHPDGPPYFEEFTPLLRKRGIAGYHRSFAFDRFFLERDERETRLQAYVSSLIELAHRSGKLPVLKFCRSQGRVAWMRAHFPSALHVAVLRDPLTQWNSAWRQAKNGNAYFLAAPLAILSRHLAEPTVAQFVTRLGLALRSLRGWTFERTLERCERFVRSADTATLYRGYLAFWLLGASKSLPYADAIIDADALVESLTYRRNIEELLLASVGFTPDFGNARATSPRSGADGLRSGDVRSAHADALLGLAATMPALDGASEDAAEMVARKLGEAALRAQRGLTEFGLLDSERVG